MTRIAQSKKIKLLQMLTNFHIGGTERQVTNLALGIDSSHFDLHLACLRHSGELLAELETLRAPRPEFRIVSLYSPKTFWQGLRLAHYVRRNLIQRSEEHTSELQSLRHLVCRVLLEKKEV